MRRAWSALLLVLPILGGCVEATTTQVPAPSLPAVPDVVRGAEHVRNVELGGGNDVAFRDGIAYVSARSGLHVVDARDVDDIREIASVPCAGGDVGLLRVSGRLVATVSSQRDDGCPGASERGGIRLVDVTDPARPVVLSQVPLAFGSHTHTPYGDTGIVYNSAYSLTQPRAHHRAEILDLSDPDAPKVVGELAFPETSTSPGCHDILAEPERHRAVCAAITETQLWDTSDPRHPVLRHTLLNPAISIHHSAATARDGAILVLGDEYAGVLAPGCTPRDDAPTGALWFYGWEGWSLELLGYFPPPAGEPGRVCSAHNFGVVEGRDVVVAAFYEAGTVLVDFADPRSPRMIAHLRPTGTDAWASYAYQGLVLTGDQARGLDAFRLT